MADLNAELWKEETEISRRVAYLFAIERVSNDRWQNMTIPSADGWSRRGAVSFEIRRRRLKSRRRR
jgi:hypothetical protein